MTKITPAAAAALILPELEQLGEQEAAKLIQKEIPIAVKYLQNAEKTNPGFLNIKADIEAGLVDVFNLALEWANGVNPPAPADSTEASAQSTESAN